MREIKRKTREREKRTCYAKKRVARFRGSDDLSGRSERFLHRDISGSLSLSRNVRDILNAGAKEIFVWLCVGSSAIIGLPLLL